MASRRCASASARVSRWWSSLALDGLGISCRPDCPETVVCSDGRSRARSSVSEKEERGGGMSEAPVLVVGATGRTGRLMVARLVERGISVRALVRDADKGRRILPDEVQQFVGDVRRSETLAEPIAGANAVIIATCSS